MEKISLSMFHSITTRTAGFNVIGMNSFHTYSLYFMCLLMFIGAGPGSTGGGIKTTTFAILIQSIRSTLRGEDVVSFFNREIPSKMVVRAISIIMISLIIVSIFIFVLIKIEQTHTFINLFFEVISAFATVGLSLGITPLLTFAGKFAIVFLMFIGRVGPLTLVLAIGERGSASEGVDLPKGRLMIG